MPRKIIPTKAIVMTLLAISLSAATGAGVTYIMMSPPAADPGPLALTSACPVGKSIQDVELIRTKGKAY